jgi:hypothetical protein
MGVVLLVSAIAALVAALLAAAFLPNIPAVKRPESPDMVAPQADARQ